MKQFSNYKAAPSAQKEALPAGGYVAKTIGARVIDYDWGSVLAIAFDITEGQFKGHFDKEYNSQIQEDKKWKGVLRLAIPKDDGSEKDDWTKRSFGNAMWAIEESNPGYHWNWDENSLASKNVGVLFRNKEWEFDGRTGWTTECCALTTVENIREGKFKMPKDKPLKNSGGANPAFAPSSETEFPFF